MGSFLYIPRETTTTKGNISTFEKLLKTFNSMGHERNRSGWPSPWQKNPKRFRCFFADGFYFLLRGGPIHDTLKLFVWQQHPHTCASFWQRIFDDSHTKLWSRWNEKRPIYRTVSKTCAAADVFWQDRCSTSKEHHDDDALLRRSYLEIKFA